MDFNSLKEQVSNLSLYDLKAGVRKVQNGTSLESILDVTQLTISRQAVMNFTEMEAKVRVDDWPRKPRLTNARFVKRRTTSHGEHRLR